MLPAVICNDISHTSEISEEVHIEQAEGAGATCPVSRALGVSKFNQMKDW
jgi:hypothetical protein